MVQVCVMVESEENMAWRDWVSLAEACERYGVAGLFGADHYLSVEGRRDRGSLDVWTVLAGLGALTERIRLGTLVSPVTFRHPSLLGKIVTTVDHISAGRVEVGFGAGWFQQEHDAYGFPFPSLSARVDMLAEALRIVHQQWTQEVVNFQGRHYRLEECPALFKPVQRPRPRIIVGGAGGPRSVTVAAQWADEYNVAGKTADECSTIRARLDAACRRHGRAPGDIDLSYMTATLLGRDHAEVERRAAAVLRRRGDKPDVHRFLANRGGTWFTGTVDEVASRIRDLEAAGVRRVYLQHVLHDDLDMVRLAGQQLTPAVA
jgi:F420-dependent oxidoreductase-like protein